VSQKAGS